MKKKEPKPFVPPEKWTWWRIPYYSEELMPFRPTHEEWWWVHRGCPSLPLTEHEADSIRVQIEKRGHYKITKARGYDNEKPESVHTTEKTNRILSYAIIREKHPLVLPATMTDEHFI